MSKIALVIGGTGLVGQQLIKLLLEDEHFSEIRALQRRKTDLQHPKLKEYIVDFDEKASWAKHLEGGEALFSCLGTTLKQAGSKEAQYKIDYTYQYEFAQEAAAQSVPTYVLVSSAGASEKSWFFYSRMKGELELATMRLNFQHIVVLRPSLLLGERKNKRLGESIGEKLLAWLNAIGLFKRYRGIEGRTVARAMLVAAKNPDTLPIYELDEIFALVGERGAGEAEKMKK